MNKHPLFLQGRFYKITACDNTYKPGDVWRKGGSLSPGFPTSCTGGAFRVQADETVQS